MAVGKPVSPEKAKYIRETILRALKVQPELTTNDFVKRFGICHGTIRSIVNGTYAPKKGGRKR